MLNVNGSYVTTTRGQQPGQTLPHQIQRNGCEWTGTNKCETMPLQHGRR